MRVDKELLIKQHFWILLALFLILWLVAVVMIKTSAAAAGGKAKSDFDSSKAGITGAEGKSSKNDTFNAPWNEYGKTYRGQKEKVWGDAWNIQKDMFDWPYNSETPLNELKYYDDKIEYNHMVTYKDDLWKKQYMHLEDMVAPVPFAGGYSGFVRIMTPGFSGISGAPGGPSAPAVGGPGESTAAETAVWDNFWQRLPTEEECWLAQEDFWVKRELLRIIHDAVENVARFTEVKDEKKAELPQGIYARHLFRNNLWEIDFQIEQQGRQWIISDRGTIKNLHPAHFTVPLSASPTSGGLHFVVKQENKKYPFRIDGEPLAYEATAPFRQRWKVDSIDFKKPFELEQDFEPANSPVRVIVDIQLGKQSHRTASMPMMMSITNKPAAPDSGGGQAAPPAGAAPKGPAVAAGQSGVEDFTPNRLPRKRYIFRTEQCRHIPIAMHLIVDQTHMHEVLVAMSNSRLRVQTTQVEFRHYTGFHSAGAQTVSDTGRAVATEEDQNLVELAVYGIATLYERYPPKAAATPPPPAGTSPAPQGQPAAGKAATPPTGAAPPAKGTDAGKAGAPPTGGGPGPGKAPPPSGGSAPQGTAGKAGEVGKSAAPPAGTAPPTGKPADPGKPTDSSKSADPAKPADANGAEPKKP
jgi:hypothetical protein